MGESLLILQRWIGPRAHEPSNHSHITENGTETGCLITTYPRVFTALPLSYSQCKQLNLNWMEPQGLSVYGKYWEREKQVKWYHEEVIKIPTMLYSSRQITKFIQKLVSGELKNK